MITKNYFICPICGEKHIKNIEMFEPPFDKFGGGSFEICKFCGVEYGYEIIDIQDSNSLKILRNQILQKLNLDKFPLENIKNLQLISIPNLQFELKMLE